MRKLNSPTKTMHTKNIWIWLPWVGRLRSSKTWSAVRVVEAVRVTVGGVSVVERVLGLSFIFLGAFRLYGSLCCVSHEAPTLTTLKLIGEGTDRACILSFLLFLYKSGSRPSGSSNVWMKLNMDRRIRDQQQESAHNKYTCYEHHSSK